MFVNKKAGFMGFFDRKKTNQDHQVLLDTFDDEQEDAVNHNSVIDYMIELDDEEYDKLLKSAKVYRDANRRVADIMGVPSKAEMGEKIEVKVLPPSEDKELDLIEDEIEQAKSAKPKDAKK